MNGYTALAACYDRFVGADYTRITAFIHQKLQQHYSNPELICDIGCGSGNVTFPLLALGYDLIGVDGSVEMLNEAMQKKASAPGGERALFLCQELPEFELYGTVDAIISTLDTVNYLTGEKALERLFYWFRNYLNPHGLLIFDINTPYKYREVLADHCECYEDAGCFMVWKSRFNGTLCKHQITVFQEDGSAYSRADEEQVQRCYPPDFILSLLARFDFEVIGVYDNYSELPPSPESERLTFVARTKKELSFHE